MPIQSLDIISVNIWQILISLANLLIVFHIAKKFLFKPVQKMMASRQAEVDAVYHDADQAKASAESMKTEYEAKLSGAKQEADQIVRTAQANAQRKSDSILEEATAKAEHMKKKAEEEIAAEKRQMIADVRSEISDMAVSIASKVVEREVKEQDHKHFIDEFIKNVGDQN